MVAPKVWISPSQAMDMVYDVRAEGVDALGYALLRPKAKGKCNSVAALARAKLQPVHPSSDAWRTRCGLPVTARDHRLVLAPGAADPKSIERLFEDYDAEGVEHQKLLAVVLTMRFSPDEPLHDSFESACAFATMRIARERRLTSLVVLHTPWQQLDGANPHAHILVLPRVHHASGWGPLHSDCTEAAHADWAEDWAEFHAAWRRLIAA